MYNDVELRHSLGRFVHRFDHQTNMCPCSGLPSNPSRTSFFLPPAALSPSYYLSSFVVVDFWPSSASSYKRFKLQDNSLATSGPFNCPDDSRVNPPCIARGVHQCHLNVLLRPSNMAIVLSSISFKPQTPAQDVKSSPQHP
jgi:hypothetical protein